MTNTATTASEKIVITQSLACILCLLIIAINASCQLNYVDKNLQDVAEKLNKMLPMMADSITRIDSVRAIPHSILQYNNTIVDRTIKDINIPLFTKKMDSMWVHEIKTAQELKIFYKNNVTLNYRYYDKNGELITTIFIIPEKYKN